MLDPYASAAQYERCRPRYVFDSGLDDLRFVEAKVAALRAERSKPYALSVELGCGHGRFSPLLADVSAALLATDASPGMIQYCRESLRLGPTVMFCQVSAEEVLFEGLADEADLVAAFWSLTYPIQSFFQLTLTTGGDIVQAVPNEVAIPRAVSWIERLTLESRPSRTLLATVFLPDSAEQQWVTEAWESIAPFPGGTRDFAWELLAARMERLSASGHMVHVETVRGHLICATAEALVDVFLDHHLRGLLPRGMSRLDLTRKLLADMDQHRMGDGYRIPAGFRWLHLELLLDR